MIINYDEIRQLAADYRKKYGLCSACELCKKLNISLNPMPLGSSKNCIKGFIQHNSRHSTITVNTDLPPKLQDFIIYHEIGHFAAGHLKEMVCSFSDFELGYRPSNTLISRQENTANFFAAEYYLNDEDTCEALRNYPFDTAAFALSVPPEFLDFKCRMLNKMGLLDRRSSYFISSQFLAKME